MIEGEGYVLVPGSCFEVLRDYPDGSFASVVCDPPHVIDSIPAPVIWAEIFRVAAPGAFLLAFGHHRTWHRLACAIEDGGWVYAGTLGQVQEGQGVIRRRMQITWRPIVMLCKGLDVLQAAEGLPQSMGSFTYGELVKLVTPPGGCVLDPYMGDGSIGRAALEGGFSFVGIDRDPGHFALAQKVLEAVGTKG